MNIEYHPTKVKLVPRMKSVPTVYVSPPPPVWAPPPTPAPQPRLASLEDLLRERLIEIAFRFNANNGRIAVYATVAGKHEISTDGATACEAIRKLSTVVLDMAFEL